MKSPPRRSTVPLVTLAARAALLTPLAACGCAPPPDAPAPPEGDHGGSATYGFPFTTRAGHAVTATPDDHRGRTAQSNWDIDCTQGQPIGSVMEGAVTLVRDGLPRGATYGYGNRVCVRNPDSGVEVCHNHLAAGSLPSRLTPGCWV